MIAQSPTEADRKGSFGHLMSIVNSSEGNCKRGNALVEYVCQFSYFFYLNKCNKNCKNANINKYGLTHGQLHCTCNRGCQRKMDKNLIFLLPTLGLLIGCYILYIKFYLNTNWVLLYNVFPNCACILL